jgi:hypothetical protein
MKLINKEMPVNLIFEKPCLISENGVSRNSANNINAKKIVMSDGLTVCTNGKLFNIKPNNIDPNINMGSSLSIKSISSSPVVVYLYIFKNPLLSR